MREWHGELHLRQGDDSLPILQDVRRRTDASAVYWNRHYEPAAIARDTAIKAAPQEQDVPVRSFNAALWCEPWRIATQQDAA